MFNALFRIQNIGLGLVLIFAFFRGSGEGIGFRMIRDLMYHFLHVLVLFLEFPISK